MAYFSYFPLKTVLTFHAKGLNGDYLHGMSDPFSGKK